MTGYNIVFVDTAPLIYFLDEDVNFGKKARLIFEEILSGGKQILSSAITCTEYLVFPYKTNNQAKVDAFFDFAESEGMLLTPVTTSIAKAAARIRAEYSGFKAMDAYHVASAIYAGCEYFISVDDRLLKYKTNEIKLVTPIDFITEMGE